MFYCAVDASRNDEAQRIQSVDNERTDRTERVEGFATRKLHVLALQVTRGHIIHTGIAKHVAERVFIFGKFPRSFPNHNTELAFVFHLLRLRRPFDTISVCDYG